MLYCIRGIQKKLFPHQKKLWQNLIGNFLRKLTFIEFCAFIAIFLYYFFSSSIPQRNPFVSCIEPSNVTQAEYICISNPEKRGDKYILTARCNRVIQNETETRFSSDASGNVLMYVPSEIIESLYPGKLYSRTSSNAVFEIGSIIYASLHYIFSDSGTPVFIIDTAEQIGWNSPLSYARALLRLQFKRLMYAWNDAGGLLLALLCGSREYLEQDVSTGFKNAGISHILALSGSHLSFFAGLSAAVTKRTTGKRLSMILSFTAVVLFVWFAGFSPSLLRAFLCSTLCLLCSLIYLKPKITSILALCFILQICISPHDGTCVSFLLSYSALLGIASIGPYVNNFLTPFIPLKICKELSASIGAQFFTIPFCFAIFGEIALIGIIATVIISPLINIFMIIGLCGILFSLCLPFTIDFFSCLMGGLYEVIRFLVLLFSQFPTISL
jgi:competence protein ComEC